MNNITTKIGDFINTMRKKINEFAEETGFKVRESKIKPETFVLGLTAGQTELHEVTLDTLVGKLEEFQKGLSVTKQALHPRMDKGVDLLIKVYNLAFTDISQKSTNLEHIEVLKQFKDIKITDGTTISLPNNGGAMRFSSQNRKFCYGIFEPGFGFFYFSDMRKANL